MEIVIVLAIVSLICFAFGKSGAKAVLVVAAVLTALCAVGFVAFIIYARHIEYLDNHKDDAKIAACTQRGGTWIEYPSFNSPQCYVPPTPAEIAQATKAREAEEGKQALALFAQQDAKKRAIKLAADMKTQKEAEAQAETQRVFAANVSSVYWESHQFNSTYFEIKLKCKIQPNIPLGKITNIGPRDSTIYRSSNVTNLSDYDHDLQDHTTLEQAQQDVLHNAHYELCTQ